MYAPAFDPSSCPDCGQWHGGNARCPACGLPLTGPLAAELWSIDTSIAALRVRRTELIGALRQADVLATAPAAVPAASATAAPAGSTMAPAPASAANATATAADAAESTWAEPFTYPARGAHATGATPPRQRTEWTQKRVQNLLLGLGVLLLAVAAIIFAAVAWRSLGLVGQAAVMAAVTAAAAAAAPVALRRWLPATGEAISALAVLLLLIDAYALRRSVPTVGETTGLIYWAAATALVAALCALYAAVVPLRTPRAAAAAAAMLPLPLLAIWSEDVATAALLMLAQAGVSAGAATVRRLGREPVLILRAGAIGAGAVGASLAGIQAFPLDPAARGVLPGAALLVLAAAVSVLSGWLRRESTTMVAIAGGRAAFALVLAVIAVARLSQTEASLPAVAALAGLCAVAASLRLGPWERGPQVVGAAVVGLALLVHGSLAAVAVIRPLLWLEDVWGLRDATTLASHAVPGGESWLGSAAVLVTLVAAAVAAWLLGRRTGRTRDGLLAAGGLLTLAAATAPTAFSWTYAVAIGWLVALAVNALAAAWWLAASRPRLAVFVALPGAALLAVAVGWSLANETATIAVVGVGAVALAALASRSVFRLAAASGSALLALGCVYAVATSSGAAVPPSAFALVVAAAAVAGVAWLLRGDRDVRMSLEAIGAAAYFVGLMLATVDVDWLAAVLTVGVLTAAALACDPDRRPAAALAGALAPWLAWNATAAFGGTAVQQAVAVAVTGCALVGVGWLLRSEPPVRLSLEAIGAAAYFVGLMLTTVDVDWLTAVLAVGVLTAAALACDPDRRPAAALAGALAPWLAWNATAAFGGTAVQKAVAVAVTGCALVGVGWLLRRDQPVRLSLEAIGAAAYGVGLLLSVPDVAWCTAVLALGVLTAAAVALDPARRDVAALSAALTAGLAWSATAAFGGSVAQQGLAVAVAGCALAGVGWLLRTHSGELVEAVAAVAYAVGAVATAVDLGALSVALAAGGATALAVALRPDRRQVAYLGAALLCGCLWVRLAIAEVSAPEPYVLPPALAALVFGDLRRRADASVGSWAAYGPGLVLALVPTLYLVFSDQGLTRPLLLGAGALAVLLLGVRDRLQAPLVLGGAALAIDALIQIAPYAAALPRWVSIGAAGLLLVGVGATYEQRLRDLRRIQDRFDALA